VAGEARYTDSIVVQALFYGLFHGKRSLAVPAGAEIASKLDLLWRRHRDASVTAFGR
jgi:hypothetical protein